jgi:hypothetical protein
MIRMTIIADLANCVSFHAVKTVRNQKGRHPPSCGC